MIFENEYKERAYSVWKYWKEKSLNVCTLLEAIVQILDVDSKTLGNEFEERYEAEQDSFEKVKSDTLENDYWTSVFYYYLFPPNRSS